MKHMLLLILLLPVVAVTTAAETKLPRVELDFGSMRAGDWERKRLVEVIPANTVKRIVRVSESGFGHLSSSQNQQADYDAFFAHLFRSSEVATDWSLRAEEHHLADLVVLTQDGKLFHIEIVGSPQSPSAILIHGEGKGARIGTLNFRFPEPKK